MGRVRITSFVVSLAAVAVGAEIEDLVLNSGLPAGLVVVVGDPEPGLGEALARSGRWRVHRLVPQGKLEELRRGALEAGLHGWLVVDAVPKGGRLRHPDRFADVVVADLDAGGTREAELLRLLNVEGAAVLRRAGKWQVTPRSAEEGIDEWTHKWHGPSGHPMSLDHKAGPPTAIQWVAGPALADGSTPGKHPAIGSGVFAAVDNVDGAVQVRSAGSGLPRWHSGFALPILADLVIDNDRLLCRPLATDARDRHTESGQLVAYDLASGREAMRYGDAPQIGFAPGSRAGASFPATLAVGDRLVVAAGSELVLLHRGDGKRLWTRKLEQGSWFSPVVLDGVVVAVENAPDTPSKRARIDNAPGAVAVSAFALADGSPKWRVESLLLSVPRDERGSFARASLLPLVAAEGKVFLHTSSYQCRQPGAYIAALDLRTGKQLWRHDLKEEGRDKWSSTDSASRVVCRDGTLYYMGGHSLGGVAAFDAATGAIVRGFQRRPAGFGHNGECTGSLATVNWLITSSVTWWDRGLKPLLAPAARSSCGTGIFPTQGMVFTNPTGCDCTSYARGYLGLRSAPLPPPIPDEQRLVRGPAFSSTGNRKPEIGNGSAWPTFLANPQRSGATPHGLPDKLTLQWRVAVAPPSIAGPLLDDRRRDEYWNGPLTAPVAAEGKVVVGLADAHALTALDASTGKLLWRIPLSGPMDSPPTIQGGLCLLGTQDGWVHALRLDDGTLAWRFLAAPSAVPAMLHGRLASAFPVPGSVLVLGDTLLATAGYHSYLGGIHAWALDPATGQVSGRSTLTGGNAPREMPMVLNDVLCASLDGRTAWIFRDYVIGPDAQRLPVPRRAAGSIHPAYAALAVCIDRRAALMRFTHDQRGGSTHGWGTPMGSGDTPAFRIVRDGSTVYALHDPRSGELRFRTGPHASKTPILFAKRAEARRRDAPLWGRTPADLGFRESYTSLIKAGKRLYLGGGKRDGTDGCVQVVSAADGKLLQELELPGQVGACGLAAAEGRLYASCLDGSLACLGGVE